MAISASIAQSPPHGVEEKKAEISAIKLASKYVKAILDSNKNNFSTIWEFRSSLLLATLNHAKLYSEYYNSVLSEYVIDEDFSLENLSELPILHREQIETDPDSLRTSSKEGFIQTTTGTSGNPLTVYRTTEEVAFLERFQFALNSILDSSDRGVKKLILNFPNDYHGATIDLPRRGHVLTIGLWDEVLLVQIKRWLTEEHSIPNVAPRVTVITGAYRTIQILTWFLKESGFDFKACAVERLYLMGGHITPHWLAFMKRTWDSDIIPVYSMTEVFTYSNLCPECGAYHFLPNVISELVDPLDPHRPADDNVGALLLTALFPFQQGQPAIRYATGDLFARQPTTCPIGEGFVFLGRTAQSWILSFNNDIPVVIGAATVVDALDDIADIRRTPFLAGLPGIETTAEIGRPDCSVSCEKTGDGQTQFRVEPTLRYDPSLYPESASRCTNEIRAEIFRRNPRLKHKVRESKVVFTVECRRYDPEQMREKGDRVGERVPPNLDA